MAEKSVFVSSIERLCDERSKKWPTLKNEYYRVEKEIKNYYDTSDSSELDSLLKLTPGAADINASLPISCNSGDVFITGFLLKNGADPNVVLNNKYFLFDPSNISITVELLKRTDYELFNNYVKTELNERTSNWISFHRDLIADTIIAYSTIRKADYYIQEENLALQNYKRQREDITFFLSLINEAKTNPLSFLEFPGEFDSPIPFSDMLIDKGDVIDSRFARQVVTLLSQGLSLYNY